MTNSNTRVLIAFLEIILALFLGIAIAHFGLGGVAWIFGGMGAGVIVMRSYQTIFQKTLKPNKAGRKIGQAMVGLSIGFAIADSNLWAASSRLPLFIFLTLFMLLCGSGIGYFYSRISHTNLLNAMLATVPGGVATMSSIAAEYNRNVSLVAMVQTLRITSVVLIIPLIAGISDRDVSQTTFSLGDYVVKSDPIYLCWLILAIISAWLGVKLASKLRIPAASFFGTLVVGIVFNNAIGYLPFVANVDFVPPESVSVIGQILLGITVGEAWSNRVDITGKSITYAFISVAMTIASGFIAATIASQLTPWDWLTCMLVTAPGGSTEMILVALTLDHNPEIVTVAHSVRLMALNLSLPLWLFLFRYWEKQTVSH
ncbi:Membrane protein AbrB duplication [Hyella patelloides LEGE 07179]|uniref:Membrane protein AbrB duplication n=1 Tax=Hyella patelloides LEGE 07179 TaxID=945734 RepID=A0A563VV29_9CYAN|nr:AbrB family transcriptional regulator [Hyella patelloides]VEP15265.1 Membrane protein AbrB duplication [Hyella patelloides LEGE 07179]